MRKRLLAALLLAAACACALLAGCTTTSTNASDEAQSDNHLTVYLWRNSLLEDLAPYIKQQLPDADIEFIVGNNNVDLYNYLQEHGSLPDIITTRRFSAIDAQSLQPYLLDFSSYDITSEYSPYALQYCRTANGEIQWLPICGIPETTIVNKSLLDRLGLSLPHNYAEFAQLCRALDDQGVKPYACELISDWADHSVLQGAAIDQFESIEGIEWRSQAENAQGDIAFNDELWSRIFDEVNTFVNDTHLDEHNVECTLDKAREEFISGQTAMFRGTPEVMDYLKVHTSDELVRLPYFSQTSNESWVYTYASMNVALSKSLEGNKTKLNTAMDVMDCLVSEQGQRIIAGGSGMVSYNVNVPSVFDGMQGIEQEVANNQIYIRYASNNSFTASLKAVQGLASKTMDPAQAYDVFKTTLNSTTEAEPVATFATTYELAQNSKGRRDAASSILATVRAAQGAQLALTPYSYYTAPLFAGPVTEKQLTMLTAQNDGTALYTANLTGAQVKALVEDYLTSGEGPFAISSRYQLPIASGMKLQVAAASQGGFKLQGIQVDGAPINEGQTYSVLLTSGTVEALKRAVPDAEPQQVSGQTLSKTWVQAIEDGQQPAQPEDYIALAK